jgi:hypothetical protein
MKTEIKICIVLGIGLRLSAYGADGYQLDKPIVVHSIADLTNFTRQIARSSSAGADGSAFDEATLYMLSCTSRLFDAPTPSDLRNKLIDRLISGRTPREIIILANVLRLEEIRRTEAEDDLQSRTESRSEAAADAISRRARKEWNISHEEMALQMIEKYLGTKTTSASP